MNKEAEKQSPSSILIPNKAKFKLKTTDNHVLDVFSAFYKHPAMLNEDAWTLMKGMKVMVDVDTMLFFEGNETEFGWNKDKLETCKISSKLEGDELTKHWNKLYKHALRTKKRMAQHFDQDKVTELFENLQVDTKKSDSLQDC